MEIKGKIITVLPLQSGVSQRTGNTWAKQEYVMETSGQFPTKVCFEVFGQERINNLAIQQDEQLTIMVDLESREYNGRWFTTVRCYNVERGTKSDSEAPAQAQGSPVPNNGGGAPQMEQPAPSPAVTGPEPTGTSDDLPF